MNVSGDVSVVLAGGGTAGHVEPALAVADALTALHPGIRITALGTERGLETRLVPERGYDLQLVIPVPLPRRLNADLFRLPWRVRSSVRQTKAVLDRVEADVIVGFGGYVAVPAYLAARGRHGVPVVVHEANARAGLANRLGARIARRVLAAVPGSGLAHAEVVGMPLRASITGLDRPALRAQARAHFGFSDDAVVLLVFGGSQGAVSINRAVSAVAGDLTAAGISVLHAHGPKNTLDLPDPRPGDPPSGDAPYVAVPYLSRMDLAYAAADLAICRSGAMTVAEVSAVGLPAIYVPLPIGNGEQRLNALPVVEAGGGLVVDDADLTPDYLRTEVVRLITDGPRLAAMTDAAGRVGHRDAARRVAEVVLEVAHEGREVRR